MIFVCLGTQIFAFDRLLKELDNLLYNNLISEEVFAQTGTLNYIPKYFKYEQFLSREKFEAAQKNASLIISHGGTGALISASKLGKNIIAVPRLAKFGEHVDDHQLQIVNVLESQGYVRAVYEIEKLGEIINEGFCGESNIIEIIDKYIEETKR